MKFDIWVFFENLSRKLKFHYNLTKITGTLHEADRYTFWIISRSVLLRMRNVSDKSCRENQNTTFVFKASFFLLLLFFYRARLWDNVGKYCRAGQATDDNMAHACCNSGCTNAPECYVSKYITCLVDSQVTATNAQFDNLYIISITLLLHVSA
jgi:hypothetical protein